MISIIIPTHESERFISKTIKHIQEYMKDKDYEIIVVDDGSKDNTRTEVEKFDVILNKKRENKGKGFSVREGVQLSKGDLVLFIDDDLDINIENLEEFLKHKEYDIIIPYKYNDKRSLKRKIFSKVFILIVKLLFNIKVKNTQVGFKLFNRKVVDEIFPKLILDGFAFDVELLYLCQQNNFRIKELPIEVK